MSVKKVVLQAKSKEIEGKPINEWLVEKGVHINPMDYGVKVRNIVCADIEVHSDGVGKWIPFSNTILLMAGQKIRVHGNEFVAVIT